MPRGCCTVFGAGPDELASASFTSGSKPPRTVGMCQIVISQIVMSQIVMFQIVMFRIVIFRIRRMVGGSFENRCGSSVGVWRREWPLG